MTGTTDAGSSPEGDGKGQAAASPASESQGGGGSASDKDVVPKTQFLAAIGNLQRRFDELAEENRALKAQNEQARNPPPKQATRAELAALVANGDLNQDQADQIWENQIIARAEARGAAAAEATSVARERAQRVEAELAGYRETVAEAWVEGSAERDKVRREFQILVDRGFPASRETEAAALRAAFGDLDTLKASKSGRPGPADTHQESGGSRPAAGGGAKDILKSMSEREKDYYTAQVKNGAYKNWDEVREVLKHADPARRQRMGARL